MVGNTNRISAVVVLSLVLSLAAEGAAAQDKRGFAVNAGVGMSQIKDKDGADKFDGNAFGYTLGGEFRFNENFALGFGVFSLGTADDDFNGVNTDIEVNGTEINMRFIMPVSDSLEFFGKVGSAWYSADLEPGGSNGLGDTAIDFGVGLDIGRSNLTFRLAGTYFDGTKNESGALISAGINYRF
jgi:hypothetical protein